MARAVGNRPARKPRPRKADTAALVLDTALAMAAETPWYDLSMNDIAARAGLSLNDVRAHYADTNAIADAWFARALDAMLAPPPGNFAAKPVAERLEILLLRWFDALAPHHRATVDMLRSKFHLPHVHHWSPLVFVLSRHVQLWRDTAGLRAKGRQRQIEEIGLTAIFLATLARWCGDESEGQQATRAFLSRRLASGDRFMARYVDRPGTLA